jgi:hypothetical protein
MYPSPSTTTFLKKEESLGFLMTIQVNREWLSKQKTKNHQFWWFTSVTPATEAETGVVGLRLAWTKASGPT